MSRFQAGIFDLDGVLCHTDQYHYQAWKAVAEQLGLHFDSEMNDSLRGVSRMASFEIILNRNNREMPQREKNRWIEKKNHYYQTLLSSMTPSELCPMVKRTLDGLRKRGLLLAVGSSSKNAPLILSRLGLKNYFDTVVDGNSITQSKPNPEVFIKAGKELRCPASACFVVEDAKAGIQAAKAAGMYAVSYGGDAVGCGLEDCTITNFSELLYLVDNQPV